MSPPLIAFALALALAPAAFASPPPAPTGPSEPVASPAAGPEPLSDRLELVWDAPAGCPGRPDVLELIASLLRRAPPDADREPLTARAIVTRRTGERWQLRLHLQTARGRLERQLRAESCLVLARAAALVIGVQLDPLAARRGLDAAGAPPQLPPDDLSQEPVPTPVEPAPVPPPPPLAPTPTPARATPVPDDYLPEETAPPSPAAAPDGSLSQETAPRPPALPALTGHVRVDGGLDVGLLPAIGGNIGVFGGITRRRFRIEAGVLGVPRRFIALPGELDGRARFDRVAGVVRACGVWQAPRDRPPIALWLCGSVEAGGIRGAGLDATDPRTRWAPWAGLGLGPGARIGLRGPLGLVFSAESVIALTRPEFIAGATAERVFQPSITGLRINLGLDLQFPARKF